MRKYQRALLNGAFVLMIIAVIIASLTGCAANDGLASQFKAGDNKNYIAGDGSVTEFAEANRKPAVVWSGLTEGGQELGSEQLAGKVVVMNYWYAGCAPCRAEAPDLVALAKKYPDVQFVGVNVRDTAETALAFDRNFNITWPSIIDAKTGSVLLAFTGIVTPQAVPTTLVIGKDGKVAARVLGRIDQSILGTLIKTAIEE
ncbi:TlpA disulfide reductase family protein [Rhodoluna sp.]|uniref:TlpA family protein disulfide reductase n=1 Tax=Rhodoluna sp. TaxID=1969481 RepID=UPI0025FDA382|nr:TlpA disulfide reductase family protein [Rhodoluna sp.]